MGTERYPAKALAIALLCNTEEVNPALLARSVADIYLGEVSAASPVSTAAAATPRVSLSADQLASRIGLYRDPANPSSDVVRVVVRDDKLFVIVGSENLELTAVNPNRFLVTGTPIVIELVPAVARRAQELHVIGAGSKPEVLQQVTPHVLSSADLRAFEGDYTSPELEVTYKVVVRDSTLVIQIPGRADIALRPIFADAFEGFNVVAFARDADGTVTGFTLNSTGVRSLRFERVTQ